MEVARNATYLRTDWRSPVTVKFRQATLALTQRHKAWNNEKRPRWVEITNKLQILQIEIQYKFQYKLKGSVHEKFGIWIKGVPKSIQRRNSRPGSAKRTAEPFQIETGVPNQFRRRTFGSWKLRRLNRALQYNIKKGELGPVYMEWGIPV